MKRLITLVTLVMIGCGGGGSSPKAACKRGVEVTCAKLYECFTEAELMAVGYPSSEAACVTMLQEQNGCDAQTEDNACSAGETYHGDEASTCIDQIGNLDCATVRMGTDFEMSAPACGRICTVE